MSLLSDLVGAVTGFVADGPVAAATLAAGAAGAAAAFSGARDAAEALDRQASRIEDLGEDEARFVVEQADIEANLILAAGEDEAEALDFNRARALENAAWERRAGGVALGQAERRWRARIGDATARFAASGATLEGTTATVLEEMIGEMEEDLFNITLNAERAAARQESQADLFTMRHGQVLAAARRRADGRRALGLLEAGTAETTAAARAQAARTRSRAAGTAGVSDLLRSGSSLLSRLAEFDLPDG